MIALEAMLTFNKVEGFIHCDLFEETRMYPQDEFITVDGEWYRIAGILKVSVPENVIRALNPCT